MKQKLLLQRQFVALLQTIQQDTFVIVAILCEDFIVNVLFSIVWSCCIPVKSEKRKTDRLIQILVRVYSSPWKQENIFHSATVSIFPTHVYFIAAISILNNHIKFQSFVYFRFTVAFQYHLLTHYNLKICTSYWGNMY